MWLSIYLLEQDRPGSVVRRVPAAVRDLMPARGFLPTEHYATEVRVRFAIFMLTAEAVCADAALP